MLGASLVPVLALGAVGTGVVGASSVAVAAPGDVAGPWSSPTALTGTTDIVNVIDVRTAADGTVVAAMYRELAGTSNLELRVAVRPANSATWGQPTVLDTMYMGRESVQLLPAPNGSVHLTWIRPGGPSGAGNTVRTSTLEAGATNWSATVDIAEGPNLRSAFLAIGPSGRMAATWSQGSGRATQIFVSERDDSIGTWSTAQRLDDTPAETLEGGSQILIAADGSLTVVWSENGPDHQAVIAVDKAPGTSRWSAPRRLSAPSSWAGDARVGTGSDGRAVLVWIASEAGGGPTVMEAVVRPAGSTQWGPIEAVGPVDSPVTTQPLVAPNGEVTLVWVGFMPSGGYATLTSTRSAAGAWSAVRTLSTEYVPEQFDAEIGPDGTVHAGWVQNAAPGSDSGRIFRHAARVNGVWTAPTTLSRKPSSVAIGQVAGGPQGRTTAVWHESTGDFIGQLWTAGTGLTKPEPPVVPAVRRDYVGAGGFVDLFARTSSGALTVYQGNASRVFSAKAPGGTWPTTSTLIPFGDLNADGVNDVLVRDSVGGLRAYYPEKGKAVTPTSRSAVVGSGWTGFNAFVVSGDFTGDGRTDLVARQTSTGDLYLYAGNSKGGLTRTGRIGTKWKPMTIVGAGDLNGDKRADLLARDAAGVLWRYYGNGKGGIGAGAKAGSGWNGFTAIVGVGDLTKDGKDDLVGRDAAGTLWRYDGTGAGRFSGAVKIGIGWNGFATLS